MQGTEVLGVRFALEERAAYAKRGSRTGVVILVLRMVMPNGRGTAGIPHPL